MRLSRAFVDRGRSLDLLTVWTILSCAAAVACLAMLPQWVDLHSTWARVGLTVATVLSLLGAVAGLSVASAFRMGWITGRGQMIAALREARKRGLTVDEWVAAEIARDKATLGLDSRTL